MTAGRAAGRTALPSYKREKGQATWHMGTWQGGYWNTAHSSLDSCSFELPDPVIRPREPSSILTAVPPGALLRSSPQFRVIQVNFLPTMPHTNAFFSLQPLNDKACRVVMDRDNRRHVSTLPDGTLVLDVGRVRSDAKDDVTLATIARNGDIHVDEGTISRNQCAFELVRETGVIMFHDRSHAQSSQVFDDPMNPRAAVPFEHGRVPR